MEQTSLNQKSWYRALKVLFVLAFIFGQGLGFLVTKAVVADAQALMILCSNGSEFVSPSSLYSDVDKLAVNLKCNPDGKAEQITGGRVFGPRYYSTHYSDKYSSVEKVLYYLLSFFIISAIFWLISRTFFYIFAKEKFLKFPAKQIVKL